MKKQLKNLGRRVRGPLAGAAATSALLLAQGCAPPPSDAVVKDAPEVEASARLNPNLATALDISRFHMSQLRTELGLDADHTFRARNMLSDEVGLNHVRYEQLFQGVRVWGGDAIVHLGSDGSLRDITNDLRTNINVGTRPGLSASYALDRAHRDLRPRGGYAYKPTAELVVYPLVEERVKGQTLRGPGGELNAEDIERVTTGYTLVYHVRTALQNGVGETSQMEYIIDANSGAILKKWNGIQTVAANGTGNTQYSGVKTIGTNSITGGWELRDVARSMNYATYNLNHATSGQGTIYTDTDNTWGDGANYVEGSSTTAANGQTAGADAHFGVGATFDYFNGIHGRNGIDGTGRATYSRVHYSNSYDNAFWDDTCFCMTYGDGSSFTTLTSIDVAGHEMTHGVTANTARLVYSGESGGLNESMSDIHGTMVEFNSRGGLATGTGNWLIGEQLNATPLRYMDRPSRDGSSRDAWSSTLGSIDVHFSSGPMNRAFYFLSQGAGTTAGANNYSSYLPCGMTGIGNDHAARIAYRALAQYMTSTTNYAGARTAFLNAAGALYGTASADYTAVGNAFAAINVGTSTACGGGGGSNVIQNPGFESGTTPWVQTAGVIDSTAGIARTGSWAAWLNGYGTTHTDSIYQTVTVPSSTARLCFYLRVTSAETTTTTQYDRLQVQIRNTSGTVLSTLATFSNLNRASHSAYTQQCYNVGTYNGQSIRPYFLGTEDASAQTSFFIDDVSLQ